MTVIYSSARAEVHAADARDVLAGLATESVELVVTDPPYGAEWQSNLRTERFDQLAGDGADERAGIAAVLGECVRLVAQDRHLYVFGPADVLAGFKLRSPTELIWDKGCTAAGNLGLPWGPQHERITFAVSAHRHAGETGSANLAARMRKGSVLRYPRVTGRKVRHPSEKPVGLLRELIESSSRPGDLVLDPFAGIGSTGVAAVLAGRRTLLVEVDLRYAAIAVERLRRAEALADQAETI